MVIVDIEPMILGLKSDDALRRREAAEALGQVGNPYAIEHLCKALTDTDPNVRNAVIAALVRFGEVGALCEALKIDDDDMRCALAEAICQTESAVAVTTLCEYIKKHHPKTGNGEAAAGVFALAKMAANCGNQEVRGLATAALRDLGRSRVNSELYETLKDGAPQRRKLAAEALGLMGNPGSAAALCRSLEDPDPAVRQEAAKALGGYDYAAAVPALCSALQDENWWVRWRAAESLGIIGDVRAVEALCNSLADSEISVRRTAAEALGVIGDPAAVWHLCRARQTQQTAKVATEALERIGSDSSLPLQVLEYSRLTAESKLDTLEAMRQAGISFGAIDQYCENVIERGDAPSEAKLGAAAVLKEIKRRQAGMELLRAGERDATAERAELLRGASGSKGTDATDELLQASAAPADRTTSAPKSLFERLFGRR